MLSCALLIYIYWLLILGKEYTPRLPQPFYLFHSIPFFHFFQSSKLFYSISLFSTIFFNFPNPYTISLNFNHLYHLKICKVKPFYKPFRIVKNGWNGFPKHNYKKYGVILRVRVIFQILWSFRIVIRK